MVFFLPRDVFLPDAGADVEDEENGAATKEDEQGASRCLRINQSPTTVQMKLIYHFKEMSKIMGEGILTKKPSAFDTVIVGRLWVGLFWKLALD